MRNPLSVLKQLLFKKEYLQLTKLTEDIDFLEDQIEELEEQLMDAEEKLKDPIYVLNYILPDKIPFFDYTTLNKADLVQYQRDTQMLNANQVFHNEINFLMDNYAIKSVTRAKSKLEMRDIRSQCLALAALRDRIASIPAPEAPELPAQDPFSEI